MKKLIITTPLENSTNEQIRAALGAVMNLHIRVQAGPMNRGKSGLRTRCTECGFAYPCPTVEAIEKECAGVE